MDRQVHIDPVIGSNYWISKQIEETKYTDPFFQRSDSLGAYFFLQVYTTTNSSMPLNYIGMMGARAHNKIGTYILLVQRPVNYVSRR